MAEQRRGDVGGEGDLPGNHFAVSGSQVKIVVVGLQLQDRAVFEQLNALLKANAAQFSGHFRRVEQGVIGFEQAGRIRR
ncbi:hypothetical protein D3C72_1620490 [compost metagenome]